MQDYSLRQLKVPLGHQIKNDGKQYLYFGGTAYLGIPKNDDFLKLYIAGIDRFGLNNGTSRGNNIQLGIYNETENFAAKKFGSEAALITSSGYLAAQLTIKQVLNFGQVRYAPDTHPALWQNEDPKVKGSFKNWANHLVAEINESVVKDWVIVSNAMNNLHPEIYDFSFVEKLNKKVILVIDDSHGIGINNSGSSALSAVPISEHVEVIVIASMAKALGVDAGLILGNEKRILQLKQSNEFLGASPPSAAGLFAFMNAQEIYANALVKIKNNIDLLSKTLSGNPEWNFIPDFPVYLSKNADLSDRLQKRGILISSFSYPDKNGPVINRIVLSSWHNTSDIEELINALN